MKCQRLRFMLCLFYLSQIRITSVHFTIHDMTTNLNQKLKYSELVTEGRFAEGNGK